MHPANREADRLRVIIESLAFTDPDMPMSQAAETIFKIEQRTMQLESAQLPMRGFELPDSLPETIAKFIDIQPDIQALIPLKKINAIKEVRARCLDPHSGSHGIGLREAKEGVEHYAATRPHAPVPPTAVPWTRGATPSPATVAAAISANVMLVDYGHGVGKKVHGYNKINWIKDVRGELRIGLKEAKDGCEYWLKDTGYW